MTAGKPADLLDLTPPELDHLIATHNATLKAMEAK